MHGVFQYRYILIFCAFQNPEKQNFPRDFGAQNVIIYLIFIKRGGPVLCQRRCQKERMQQVIEPTIRIQQPTEPTKSRKLYGMVWYASLFSCIGE